MRSRIGVHVQPMTRRSQVMGFVDGVLRVRLLAAPVEGRANEALVKLLAERLGVPRSRVAILRGMASRNKVVEVAGLDDEEVRRRLAGGSADSGVGR